jgi:tetratricopeptide (TPR) repeat protein
VNNPSMQFVIRALSLSFAASLFVATISHAQMGGSRTQASPTGPSTDMQQTELHELTDVQRQPGVTLDSKEQKAYDAFFHTEDSDKKIQLGNAFLEKYPKSIFIEAVDSGLTYAYYDKQDWKDYYASADRALALKPDDVDLLASLGWVIPHFYNPQDANADEQLNKAETCEKHALEVMATMPKPSGLTDARFATAKAQKAAQAHSALGLVYFRREDYANSAKELQQVTLNNPNADQTDLFVMGMDFQNMDKFGDAADAFGRCGQIAGNLQDRCKQNADMAKKKAAQPK